MAVSWYLYILILFTTIPQYYCLGQCQNPGKTKRGTVFDITDDLLVNKFDRFIRSNSKNAKQVGDVVMIMDISNSLSNSDREHQRQTLRNLGNSKQINIGKNNVRIGIIAFETKPHMILHLDEGVTGPAVVAAAKRVDFRELTKGQSLYGTTNFPDAMNLAKKEFQDRGRSERTKVAFLVTDGVENCAPWQTTGGDSCSYGKDCNQIAQMCPRPPSPDDECCQSKQYPNGQVFILWCARSAVFREFRDLRDQGVILPVIGVGRLLDKFGKGRQRCWATERLYFHLPSYNKLEKTVEKLVRTILPVDPGKDCKCKLYRNETCHLVDNTCVINYYVIITRNATGNGRPCPTERKIRDLCSPMECGVTFDKGYTPVPELVRATTPVRDRSGVAWWVIFVILLAILAILLCLAILIIAIIRKKRVRRAITSGVQPSLMQPVSGRPVFGTPSQQQETPAPPGGITGVGTPTQQRMTPAPLGGITGAGVGRGVEKSQEGVSKSAQPSTRFLGSQQRKGGAMGAFHKVCMSRPISSQTTQERDTSAQPGTSLMPTSATKWGRFGKSASKKR